MLSVCIPVCNHDARPLVHEILRQADTLKAQVELLVYDSGSCPVSRETNRELQELSAVTYQHVSTPMGRGAVRNLMAAEAGGEYLVMLDGESWPNPDFLIQYLAQLCDTVVVGGTSYSARPPEDGDYFLHWHYGRRRQALAPARRRNRFFQGNNFLVRRDIMLRYPYPDLQGNIHEDTLWGQLLVPANITIVYIENPVTHLGLLSNTEFLEKQRQSVNRLRQLQKEYPTLRTRLTTFADRYPKAASLTEYVPERTLKRYVLEKGNLKALDMLKLKWWISGWTPAIGYL